MPCFLSSVAPFLMLFWGVSVDNRLPDGSLASEHIYLCISKSHLPHCELHFHKAKNVFFYIQSMAKTIQWSEA